MSQTLFSSLDIWGCAAQMALCFNASGHPVYAVCLNEKITLMVAEARHIYERWMWRFTGQELVSGDSGDIIGGRSWTPADAALGLLGIKAQFSTKNMKKEFLRQVFPDDYQEVQRVVNLPIMVPLDWRSSLRELTGMNQCGSRMPVYDRLVLDAAQQRAGFYHPGNQRFIRLS